MSWLKKTLGGRPVLAHSQIGVARFLLAEAATRNFTVTPMKLQKLVFLAHAWMLALYGLPLVRGRLEAWQYGPVFPELYHEIKHKGAKPLTTADLPAADEVFDADEQQHMIWTVERYGPLTAARLSALTHATSSPWDLTWRRGANREISADLIRFYYRTLLAQMRADEDPELQETSA